eukprot:scaffold2172_cov130-Isochrysis_galbana.AAC.7
MARSFSPATAQIPPLIRTTAMAKGSAIMDGNRLRDYAELSPTRALHSPISLQFLAVRVEAPIACLAAQRRTRAEKAIEAARLNLDVDYHVLLDVYNARAAGQPPSRESRQHLLLLGFGGGERLHTRRDVDSARAAAACVGGSGRGWGEGMGGRSALRLPMPAARVVARVMNMWLDTFSATVPGADAGVEAACEGIVQNDAVRQDRTAQVGPRI